MEEAPEIRFLVVKYERFSKLFAVEIYPSRGQVVGWWRFGGGLVGDLGVCRRYSVTIRAL